MRSIKQDFPENRCKFPKIPIENQRNLSAKKLEKICHEKAVYQTNNRGLEINLKWKLLFRLLKNSCFSEKYSPYLKILKKKSLISLWPSKGYLNKKVHSPASSNPNWSIFVTSFSSVPFCVANLTCVFFHLLQIIKKTLPKRSGTPQFSTDPLSTTQGPHLFSTQNPSVQHQKPLSPTPKSPFVLN